MIPEPHRKYTIRLWLLTVSGTLSLLLFSIISALVLHKRTGSFDRWFSDRLANPSGDSIAFMKFVTFFGSSYFLIACYTLLVGWLLVEKKRFTALVAALSGSVGYLIVYLLKETFRRPRPYRQLIEPLTNFSLPSGHACSALLLYALISYLMWQSRLSRMVKTTVTIFLLLFAFFIGFTRIYLGVHYATDVAAGFSLAGFFVNIVVYILERRKIILNKSLSK